MRFSFHLDLGHNVQICKNIPYQPPHLPAATLALELFEKVLQRNVNTLGNTDHCRASVDEMGSCTVPACFNSLLLVQSRDTLQKTCRNHFYFRNTVNSVI